MSPIESLEMMPSVEFIARGSIGCLAMLMEMDKRLNRNCYYMCREMLLALDIVGTDAYLLWNDVCHRDSVATAELLYKLKVGAIPLHVVRWALATHNASNKILLAQLPCAPWMESFSRESFNLFGRDVLGLVSDKKGE